MYETIISVENLICNHKSKNWVVVDCRYDLGDPGYGHRTYLESHITGAVFADLHDHLSGEPATDHGRHPLPTADKLRRIFASLGIERGIQVVAYDALSGAFAARLWWLLRYMGHKEVAVLDGGWQAWLRAEQALESGENLATAARFEGEPRSDRLVMLEEVASSPLLIDSREPARYRGEVEPIDPVAGHIPGAVNRCWKENLAENGCFLGSGQLKQQFSLIYTNTAAEDAVFYCGSGVTACHNLLAVSHAGLADARLYAGSWSEWCSSAARPVETGSN